MKFNAHPKLIQEVLCPFYEYEIYFKDGTKLISKELKGDIEDNYPEAEEFFVTGSSFDCVEKIPVDLIVEAYNKIPNKEKYIKIFIKQTYDCDGRGGEPRIVGTRSETEEEILKRKELFERDLKLKEQEKILKKQKVLENKKKKLEKLKEELNV